MLSTINWINRHLLERALASADRAVQKACACPEWAGGRYPSAVEAEESAHHAGPGSRDQYLESQSNHCTESKDLFLNRSSKQPGRLYCRKNEIEIADLKISWLMKSPRTTVLELILGPSNCTCVREFILPTSSSYPERSASHQGARSPSLRLRHTP